MSEGSFREVTRTSWLGRLGRSVGGVVLGFVLVAAMVALLFWNEGRAVTTARSLAEGAGLVSEIAADRVDPANEGRLVHLSGPTATDQELTDADFGVTARALRLVRAVEMYQWTESSKSETRVTLGGGEETVTTYSYRREWQSSPVDSSRFRQPDGRQNPPMEIRGQTLQVDAARLGAFTLDKPVLDRVGGGDAVAVTPDMKPSIERAFAGTARVSVLSGRIHLGDDPAAPKVGDYRVAYEAVPVGPLSVVGRQQGDRLVPYQTQAGDALLMVETGAMPAAAMFEGAEADNVFLTWMLRIGGLALLWLGFSLILGPIGVVFDVIPFLGSVARLGTGIAGFAFAALVGSATIALAWLFFRPLVALAVIAAGVAIVWLVARRGRKATAQPAT